MNAFPGKDMNELIIIWASNNHDIVNVSITLECNNQTITPDNVDWYKKGASINVSDAKAPYIIRLTEHNKCGQEFSSKVYNYNGSDQCTDICNDGSPQASGGKILVYTLCLFLSFIFSWFSDSHHHCLCTSY